MRFMRPLMLVVDDELCIFGWFYSCPRWHLASCRLYDKLQSFQIGKNQLWNMAMIVCLCTLCVTSTLNFLMSAAYLVIISTTCSYECPSDEFAVEPHSTIFYM